MWWHDIKEIKEQLDGIEQILEACSPSEEIMNEIDRIHDKLSGIRESHRKASYHPFFKVPHTGSGVG